MPLEFWLGNRREREELAKKRWEINNKICLMWNGIMCELDSTDPA